MTNPTPELPIAAEELKLVAEYMGHEAFIEGEPCHESVELIVDADKDSTYNPLTNAEQSCKECKARERRIRKAAEVLIQERRKEPMVSSSMFAWDELEQALQDIPEGE